MSDTPTPIKCANCGATRSKRARENKGPCILVRPKEKPIRYYCARPACQAAASSYLSESKRELAQFVERCKRLRESERSQRAGKAQRQRPQTAQQSKPTRQRPPARQRPAVVRQRPEVG